LLHIEGDKNDSNKNTLPHIQRKKRTYKMTVRTHCCIHRGRKNIHCCIYIHSKKEIKQQQKHIDAYTEEQKNRKKKKNTLLHIQKKKKQKKKKNTLLHIQMKIAAYTDEGGKKLSRIRGRKRKKTEKNKKKHADTLLHVQRKKKKTANKVQWWYFRLTPSISGR
jgi:hypothetical protein